MKFNNLVELHVKKTTKDKIILTDEIFCTRSYPNHPKGCPNFSKKPLCPPNTEKINLDKYNDYILFYIKFNFKEYYELRKKEHPNWTDKQVKCVLYWQGAVRKILKEALFEFCKEYIYYNKYDLFLCVSDIYGYPSMEAVGINVFSTMRLNGVKMEINPVNNIYLVSLICIKEREQAKLINIL